MIHTIDQIIAAHWGDCDVMKGETPEAYAIRHQETQAIEEWLRDPWVNWLPIVRYKGKDTMTAFLPDLRLRRDARSHDE